MAANNNGLVVHSTITVDTEEGTRQIQLCFGDITKLPVEDKMDFVMVSAFAGDYITTRTSLIGALHHTLGLSVRDLARDKKEDLRQHFHCWVSHPLPDHLPYRQLVCFETPMRRAFRHPAELVGDVFRALIPMFQNQEKSVITSLLATGDQNYSRTVMLKAMLDAAINWIRAGLGMTCLKIVLYKQDPSWLSSEEKKLCDIFTEYRERIHKMQEADKARRDEAKFDVYLSYNSADKDRVVEISKLMLKENEKLRIFDEDQQLQETCAFQDDILNTMKQSYRVVTFLSPAFLSSATCVEKYNLALCVNRQAKKNILAPFYVETIVTMPTYMTLVQYVDVRDRDGTNQRLFTGVETFIMTLNVEIKLKISQPLSMKYDVFISYSHRNSEQANHVLQLLQKLDPDLNIFFDRKELKTGFSWQQTLYRAIDNSKVMVALMSPDYLASTVSIEEYTLALSRHLTEVGDEKMELVPVLILPCDSMPAHLSQVPLLDATQDFKQKALEITQGVIKSIKNNDRNFTKIFNKVLNPLNLEKVLSSNRAFRFHQRYDIKLANLTHKYIDYDKLVTDASEYMKSDSYKAKLEEIERINAEAKERVQRGSAVADIDADAYQRESKKEYDLDKVYDVAFVCADYLHGTFLNSLLLQRAPQLDTNFYVDSEDAEMTALEKARLCVVFLSPKMQTVGKDMEELDVALARQRKAGQQPVLYPIHVGTLPTKPTFCQLLPCQVSLGDPLWIDVMAESQMTSTGYLPKEVVAADKELQECYNTKLEIPTMLGLLAACDDIIAILTQKDTSNSYIKDGVINNIVSLNLETIKQGTGEQECGTLPNSSPDGSVNTVAVAPPIMRTVKDVGLSQNTQEDSVSSGQNESGIKKENLGRNKKSAACSLL